MNILGVDPGASGALVLMRAPQDAIVTLHSVCDMPVLKIRRGKTDKSEVDGYALERFFCLSQIDVAFVEQVGGITGQSASAAFNFGRSAGIVEGWLKGRCVRVEFVAPGTWRRALHVNPGKDGSRALATRLWPSFAKEFARVKDDGRAEAALIAEYGRMRLRDER